MAASSVMLMMMLEARERRRDRQQELLAAYRLPLVCFTMNIAGDIKKTAAVACAHSWGVDKLKAVLGEPVFEMRFREPTGCEAYLVYDREINGIKQAAVEIEEGEPVGRLYDIDVIDTDGTKLSRDYERTCLVCGGPVSLCARNRNHGLPAIRKVTNDLLTEFVSGKLGGLASEALRTEAHLTPKPGLVDENNTGSHKDMDLAMFDQSAAALEPFFAEAVKLGALYDRKRCFPKLVDVGIRAEKAMFEVTGGVNTHKGAIYSFLLVLAAIGHTLHDGGDPDLFEEIRELAMEDQRELGGTHGSEVRRRYGEYGIREEARSGFRHVQAALPVLESRGRYAALLTLLSTVRDSNILYRGGEEADEYVRSVSLNALHDIEGEWQGSSEEKSYKEFYDQICIRHLLEMDRVFIGRNLSPGGCADLFALTVFLYRYFRDSGDDSVIPQKH